MFAIIDIETCGGKFDYGRGRIIEIAILIHDGLSVVDQYSTLIDPECVIAPLYTRVSGITNEMVEGAPKFYEVAKKIDEMTRECIFVAHNVKFDYSFVRDEFSSLGFTYKRETLCTVQLSRKLIPGKMSYSLGRLCESLGIEIENRHRALGDALATSVLFSMLLEAKNSNPNYKNKGLTDITNRRVDSIKKYILDKLPEECGVYYFLDKDKHILYIGKSKNMYSRAIQHFGNNATKAKKMLYETLDVDFVKTGSELIALLHESFEIKKHKPSFNSARKADTFQHHLVYFYNEKGILNFKISEDATEGTVLLSAPKYSSARESLDRWIEQKSLCLQYCGLTQMGSVCFNHQIKKCNGICADQEEIEIYNRRAQDIIGEYTFTHPNFVVFDQGRRQDERSFVMLKENRFVGYGFIDATDAISGPEQLSEYITSDLYLPDAEILIRGWMKQNLGKFKVVRY